ncbi:MAG: hypothetical protein KDK34_24885 [Leptospiraceae bacterium]|nr:hypothetical protein [Leptospiraceae bacterium]
MSEKIENQEQRASTAGGWRGRIPLFTRLANLFLLLILLAAAYGCVRFWLHVIDYEFQLNLGEGIILSEINALANGYALYPEGHDVFRASNYGPLYYLLGRAFWYIQPFAYAPLRWLSFVTLIGLMGVAYIFLRGEGLPRTMSATLSLLLLLSPVIHLWGIYLKPDGLALLLSVIAIVSYMRTRNPYIALPFFLIAFYCKQTYVAVPIVITLYELRRDFKSGIQFALIAALSGLALLLCFQWLVFADGNMWLHLVTYNRSSFHLERYLAGLTYPVSTALLLPILMLFFVRPGLRDNPLVGYLIMCTAIALVAVGKFGSDINYFMESWVAAVLLLGQGFRRQLVTRESRSLFGNRYFAGILILLAAVFLIPYPRSITQLRVQSEALRTNQTLVTDLSALIQPHDIVHSDIPGIFATIPKPLQLLIDDPTLFHLVTQADAVGFPADLFTRALNRKRLALYLTREPVPHEGYTFRREVIFYEGFAPTRLFLYMRNVDL